MHSHSEQTAQRIDTAIGRIVENALENVREILQQRRNALVALAEQLMVIESVDAPQLRQILAENSSSPRVVPGTADAAKRPPPADPLDETRGSAAN